MEMSSSSASQWSPRLLMQSWLALLRCGAEEAGKPCEGYAEGSSVAEVDPHAVGVEADFGWANGRIRSMLFRYLTYAATKCKGLGGGVVIRLVFRILLQDSFGSDKITAPSASLIVKSDRKFLRISCTVSR